MAETKIEWTDHSENPIRARLKSDPSKVGHYCEKVNAGCKNCYASNLQKRFQMPAFGSGQHNDDVEHFLCEKTLDRIRRRKKPTKYFIEDMSDLFGEWVKAEWIAEVLNCFDDCNQHIFQLLTKRPENVLRNWTDYAWHGCASGDCPHELESECDQRTGFRDNVWLGTSGADQPTANKAWNELQKCRSLSPVLFLSLEPLVGPIDCDEMWRNGAVPDWVIVGGESGPNARECEVEWIKDIVMQCGSAAVPCFVKQIGSKATIWCDGGICGNGDQVVYGTVDRKGGDPYEWPEDLRVRQFPKVVQ